MDGMQINAITIYPWMPSGCPFRKSEHSPACGDPLYGVGKAPGAPENCRAFGCEHGHRCHVYEDALDRSHAEFLEMQAKEKGRCAASSRA